MYHHISDKIIPRQSMRKCVLCSNQSCGLLIWQVLFGCYNTKLFFNWVDSIFCRHDIICVKLVLTSIWEVLPSNSEVYVWHNLKNTINTGCKWGRFSFHILMLVNFFFNDQNCIFTFRIQSFNTFNQFEICEWVMYECGVVFVSRLSAIKRKTLWPEPRYLAFFEGWVIFTKIDCFHKSVD